MVIVIKKGTPIEEIRKQLESAKSKSKKDLRAFAGTVKFKKDPLEYQKEIRNEWE